MILPSFARILNLMALRSAGRRGGWDAEPREKQLTCKKWVSKHGKIMESLLSLSRMHWDHELAIRKPLEINESVFRFMGSPLSLLRMHWDHEPDRDGELILSQNFILGGTSYTSP